ncbi:MAG: hypothetical protein LC737_10520 [Chloroflexi bacterium]|nr:hypothetical protein [Chloroflexota bacterium]
MFDLRAHLLWLITPIVLILGVAAGITSATVEEPAHLSAPPTRVGGEATAVRVQPSAVAGYVVLVDYQSRSLIVQRKDGKFVDVFIKGNTVVKQGRKNVRPRDIGVGDRVVVVGKPHTNVGLDAALVTIASKADANSTTK